MHSRFPSRLALIAAHKKERGTQLLGAAASLREELGVGFEDQVEHVRHEHAVVDAKAALGEEAFEAAWASGEAMTPDELVALSAQDTNAD